MELNYKKEKDSLRAKFDKVNQGKSEREEFNTTVGSRNVNVCFTPRGGVISKSEDASGGPIDFDVDLDRIRKDLDGFVNTVFYTEE